MDMYKVYILGVTGNELKVRRKGLGITQEGLAGKLGVASNTVARWERDEVSIPPYLPLALKQIESDLDFGVSFSLMDLSDDETKD